MPTTLSKTDFNAGLQCLKRLWLSKHDPGLAEPPSPGSERRRTDGIEIGRLGRLRYPGGVLIQWDGDGNTAQIATKQAIANGASCIYEATFQIESTGLIARCDILLRIHGPNDAWHLIEVKSAASTKPEYITDAAFQVAVAREAGIHIERVSILHIDGQYDYGGGAYDPNGLFTEWDITDKVEQAIPAIRAAIPQFQSTLEAATVPQVDTNKHCDDGPCPFYDRCHAGQPKHDLVFLPRITAKQVSEYRTLGYRTFDALPEQHVKPAWKTICSVVRDGKPWYGPELGAALAKAAFPIHFIDFETVAAGPPLYAYSKPYQQVPFQWSNHIMDTLGATIRHEEFLHRDRSDPRAAFAESLWKSVQNAATIVVYYAPFECSRVKELARDGIPFGNELSGLMDSSVLDLWKVVKEHVYHPDFNGSFSIKAVLPALAPGFSYADLPIHEGDTASLRFMEMVGFKESSESPEVLANQLLKYCEMDTLAMVVIYEHLLEIIGRASLGKGG